MEDVKLIYSFFKHPQLGLSIDAFLVKLLNKNTFSYEFKRLVYERMDDYDYPYVPEDKEILKVIGELNQKNIESYFNRKKIKWEVFLEKVNSDKNLSRAISSYFDRRISACLNLLKGRTIHWKERVSDHPGMQGFHVMSEPANVVYSFTKETDSIRYNLEINFHGRKLDLRRKGTQILSVDPCWILHNGCMYSFADGTDGNKIKPFLAKNEIIIPDKLSDQYLSSFMLKTSRKFDVRFNGFDTKENPENVSKFLSLSKDLGGTPVIQLNFRYDKFVVTPAQSQHLLVQLKKDGGQHILERYTRNMHMELSTADFLRKSGLEELAPSWYSLNRSLHDEKILIQWLLDHKEEIQNEGIEILFDWDGKTYHPNKPEIETKQLKEEKDWFDLYAIMKIGTIEIPFIRLKNHILEKNRNYCLPDGSYVLLPEEWFVKYADVFTFGEVTKEGIRLQRHHEGLLSGHPLISGDLSHHLSDQQKSVYRDLEEIEFPSPENLNASLREYQKRGFNWLCRLREKGLGACLSDDMGLGKTIQIIALLLRIKSIHSSESAGSPKNEIEQKKQLDLFSSIEIPEEENHPPSLIVMAPSLIHNWRNELNKFAPSLKVVVYSGPQRDISRGLIPSTDVVLTTYGVVRNDIEFLRQINFSCIVLDESQMIKNMRSVTFQRVRDLKGIQRIVLTGTPVENSLSDLWAQISFLQPGLLGSYPFFKREFVIPIEQNSDQSKLEKLRKLIQPFILRRTKQEVAPELPALTKSVHYCEMDEEQRAFYEKQKSYYRNTILNFISKEGIEKSQFMILRGLMKLRKIAIHPRLEDEEYSGISSKFEEVIGLLTLLKSEKKKVLIFSQFVKHLDLFRNYFKNNTINYSFLSGETPLNKRAGVIKDFEDSIGFHVFLIQLRTGGSGLNLTSADHVFIVDPWWNPAAEDQAIARSHRIGQHKPVFAMRFITKDTIEEKILRLQEKKSKLAQNTIEGSNPFGKIGEVELHELFN